MNCAEGFRPTAKRTARRRPAPICQDFNGSAEGAATCTDPQRSQGKRQGRADQLPTPITNPDRWHRSLVAAVRRVLLAVPCWRGLGGALGDPQGERETTTEHLIALEAKGWLLRAPVERIW